MDFSSKAAHALFAKLIVLCYRCIMLGEHRPALSDLLWERAQSIIKSHQSESEKPNSEQSEQQIQ